jgi:signal transduction histidine kinase
MRTTGQAAPLAVPRALLRAPVSRRARRELVFCVASLPLAVPVPAVAFFAALWVQAHGRANPSALQVVTAAAVAALVMVLMVAGGAARWAGSRYRRLAAVLLGMDLASPPPPAQRHGPAGWLARLADGPGWRALCYLLLKCPLALLGWYTLFFWTAGLVNVSYPFWWQSFRNHPPGVRLSPVPVFTPFGWFGKGTFGVTTLPGTFAALAAGIGMLLAAPWVTQGVVAADRWLMRGLLGPGGLRQRLADLERTRALAVGDSAARLRLIERNLHDGAQVRLATLALNLGMAREKLGSEGDPPDIAAARDLVGAAHRGVKDALAELRELARGIHPPVLDNGLADALSSLAAGSAIPARVTVSTPRRPSPAIEAIAYFCAAELLANAVKHSRAATIDIDVHERGETLLITVTDDGGGGADPVRGTGLAGLAQRVAVVDGQFDITSPPGGPTRAAVRLPVSV